MHILHDPPEADDLRERNELMAEVLDPDYSLHADVDAEGEADEDFAAPATESKLEVDV